MAAVLCTAPCKLCKGLCDCIGETCSCIAKPICKVMSACCKTVSEACSSPFCMFVSVATGLNFPPIVMAFTVASSFGSGGISCKGVLWLLVSLVLSVCNIAAAWYLTYKVANNMDLEDGKSAGARAAHMLCYDPIIAGYILIGIGYLVWLVLGVTWTVNGDMIGNPICPENISTTTTTALGFGWAYVFIGSLAFCCSLCCASARR